MSATRILTKSGLFAFEINIKNRSRLFAISVSRTLLKRNNRQTRQMKCLVIMKVLQQSLLRQESPSNMQCVSKTRICFDNCTNCHPDTTVVGMVKLDISPSHSILMPGQPALLFGATRGVTVSTSAFLSCHQCYCAGSSLAWGSNLRALVCGIF